MNKETCIKIIRKQLLQKLFVFVRLKEYLENHEKEVIDIMVTLYSQEEVLRDYVTSEKFTSEVKGIVELSQELGRSFADTVSYVAKKCNVSKDIAERKVNSFWN